MRHQRDQAQPFPSVREIAGHFKLPLSAVARNYAKLEREGLLTRRRSSGTLLKGRKFGRRLHVRAVIGLPASVFCFIALQDYRQFLEQIRRELAKRDFAAAQVFFRPPELQDNRLADRLTGKAVDAVVWYLPGRNSEVTIASLRDHGVPVIGICDGGLPAITCRYTIRRRPAMRRIVRDWLSKQINRVIIISESLKRSAADIERWELVAAEHGLDREFSVLHDNRVADDLATLKTDSHVGVIVLGSAASLAALRAPDVLFDLMRRCRVALPDGPVTLFFTRKVPDVRVDLVTVDWCKVAARIVDDLLSQTAFDASETTEFLAKAQLQAPIAQFAEAV